MKKVLLLILSLFISPAFASGINANSASAPCTNNTLETYSGNSNLAADWQPNTIQLRWYNENEKLMVQQSAQTCTYDGTLTVPQTPPTRTGYTFAGWEVKHTIPAEYTELEYVTNTANTYLDTGIIPNVDNTEMEIKVKPQPGSWYILQSRYPNSSYFGFGGSMYGDTINDGFANSSISRDPTHIIIARTTKINGNATLYVKDLTANIEDTATGSYTYWQQTLSTWMFGNQRGDRVAQVPVFIMQR